MPFIRTECRYILQENFLSHANKSKSIYRIRNAFIFLLTCVLFFDFSCLCTFYGFLLFWLFICECARFFFRRHRPYSKSIRIFSCVAYDCNGCLFSCWFFFAVALSLFLYLVNLAVAWVRQFNRSILSIY